MAQSEPGLYKPSDDIRAFDGGEDRDLDEEGSRLPLLIVIALLVFFAFGGVVWLAYNQGVKHGREDVSPVVAAEQTPAPAAPTPYKNLEIYQPAKPVGTAGRQQGRKGTNVVKAAPQHPTGSAKSAILPEQALKPSAAVPTQRTPKRISTAPSISAVPAAKQSAKPGLTPALAQVPRKAESKPAATAPKSVQVAQARPPVSTPATPGEAFVLQIGSYKSEAEASASWQAYKSSHPAAAAFAPDIKRADLPGKGTWFRLRIGSFPTAADALALCSKLKKSGGACFPARR